MVFAIPINAWCPHGPLSVGRLVIEPPNSRAFWASGSGGTMRIGALPVLCGTGSEGVNRALTAQHGRHVMLSSFIWARLDGLRLRLPREA